MKKETRKILEALTAANTQEEINAVCGAIDRAFQSEKISWQDNELLYGLVNKFSALIG